jgi:MFS family permease
LLLGAIGAVGIIVANAASFALAAGSLLLISQRDFPEQRATVRRSLWREVGAGLQFVWSHPVLQPVMLCGTSYMFFLSALEASLVLYCHDSLGLSASLTGVVVGAAAAGYPIGNIYSRKAVHRLGILRALVGTAALSVTGLIAMPVLGSLGGIVGAAGLILGSVVHSAGEGAYGPTSLTLRQTVTPPELLKRISAVQRFMLWGAMAAGGLLASAIISCFSLSLAVWVGALGTAVCLPLLIRRDVRRAFMPGVTFELERKP